MIDINIRDKRFTDVEKRLTKMTIRSQEFCQIRSCYQLEKFLVESEYTPITKFRHIANTSYITMQEVRKLLIERERKLRTIERKQKCLNDFNVGLPILKNDEIIEDYDLDIYELNRQLDDIEIRIKGLLLEVDYMELLCDKLEEQHGKIFTAEQLQKEEPTYWRLRFAEQMHESQIGQQLGVGEGNYRSYLQSLATPLLDKNQQIQPFPLTPDAIATVALSGRTGIEEVMLRKVNHSITENKKELHNE